MKRPTSPKKIVLFIDQYFPEATSIDRADRIIAGQRSASFVTLLDQIETIPEELLPSDEDDYSLLDLAANDIKTKLKEISTHGDRELKHIPGSGRKNALVEIRRILDNCPTRFIPAEIAGLEFVKDGAYRTILREDLAEFESYLKNREWKAATVLGAALLESILLETLSGMEAEATSARAAPKRKGKVVQDLTDRAWTLTPFLQVAKELGLIEEKPTYSQGIIAGEARNLIHPGKAQRKKLNFDSGSAFSVKAALEHTVRDLTAWHK